MTGDLTARYASILERSSKAFVREFGYELTDPFNDICEMLAAGEPFAFSRFGDGEFNAVFGVEGGNCDGHPYFSDLGMRLTEILQSKPTYTLGMQPLALLIHGVSRVHSLAGDLPWRLADGLHLALIEMRLGQFFEAVTNHEVVLVGAPHLQPLAERRTWRFVEVPARNCWLRYDSIRAALAPYEDTDGKVLLFCASMMTNVLIDDLHRINSRNTYLDVGSVFDPYVGVNSRILYETLDQTALESHC